MTQLKNIEEQLMQPVGETTRVRDELRSLEAVESVYAAERNAWEALLKERDDLLDLQCEDLTARADGAIREHVQRFADPTDFVEDLRQSLSGSRVQGAKFEALGTSITTANDP